MVLTIMARTIMAEGSDTNMEGLNLSLTLGLHNWGEVEVKKIRKVGIHVMHPFDASKGLKIIDTDSSQKEKGSNADANEKPDPAVDLLNCLGRAACGVKVASESVNKAGVKRVEKQERSYTCKYCKKEFFTIQALGGHQNAHKREREKEKQEKRVNSSDASASKLSPAAPVPYSQSMMETSNRTLGLGGVQRGSMIHKHVWSHSDCVHNGHGGAVNMANLVPAAGSSVGYAQLGLDAGMHRTGNHFFYAGKVGAAYDSSTGGYWLFRGRTAHLS